MDNNNMKYKSVCINCICYYGLLPKIIVNVFFRLFKIMKTRFDNFTVINNITLIYIYSNNALK